MPGVNTGGSGSPFDARINGGLQTGDEAVVDGVSMQEGLMSQSGMIAFSDYPISPESVSEVSILTSNYEPQYGSTTSAVITATTKSGTNEFHGGLHWFHRNTVLNARQFGVAERPKDLEHDFGVYVGGPVKLPFLWTPTRKTYFFFNYTGFRIRGSLTKPVLSVPTERMRQGDFGEWPDPIFDPLTTRANPTFDSNLPVGADNLPYLRDQFMGCDPIANPQPNVICADRIANSLAHQWFRHVPSPNRPGVLNNFEAPSGPIDPRSRTPTRKSTDSIITSVTRTNSVGFCATAGPVGSFSRSSRRKSPRIISGNLTGMWLRGSFGIEPLAQDSSTTSHLGLATIEVLSRT
jgi:hypothetical protein